MVWDVRGMVGDHEQVIRGCFTKARGDNHCHVVLVGGNPPHPTPTVLCVFIKTNPFFQRNA